MSLAEELLAVASSLKSGVTEAEWRRSASTSYYSAFHRIVEDGLSLVLAQGVPPTVYVRSLQHKEMISCADAFEKGNNLSSNFGVMGNISEDLLTVASNVKFLKGWRISADYDSVKLFGKQQAEDAYEAAKKLHEATLKLRASADQGYVCMLAAMLLKKPERS